MANVGTVAFIQVKTASGNITAAAFGRVTLEEDATSTDYSQGLPSACYLDSLDLIVDETVAGPVTTIDIFLTWDAAGDDIAAGPTRLTLAANDWVRGQTDTSLVMATIKIDKWVRIPATATVGQMYLWAKPDAGTLVFTVADPTRLNYALRWGL